MTSWSAHEVRVLRGEAQRLRQGVTMSADAQRKLEGELAIARAKIAGLESQLRAA